MKIKWLSFLFLLTGILFACNFNNSPDNQALTKSDINLSGKWVRIGQYGPIGFDFKDNGLVEGDFGIDETIDVIAEYQLSGDTIKFVDS
jgi:hypothetical protein